MIEMLRYLGRFISALHGENKVLYRFWLVQIREVLRARDAFFAALFFIEN